MQKDVTNFDYDGLLTAAISQIESARCALAVQVNTAVNSTYWNLGKLLYDKKIEGRRGDGIVKRLSLDLKARFPDLGGLPRAICGT